MTPDELMARCEQTLQRIVRCPLPTEYEEGQALHARHLNEMESLYREAMAAGLESACAYYSNQIHHDMDDYPDKFVKWCRQEAKRVKENHEDHKA